MKKLVFLIILFLSLPFIVNAEAVDVNYSTKAMYIQADISDEGNMVVKELIVLKGSFNGYERYMSFVTKELEHDNINFEEDDIYNPNDINLIKTSAKEMDDYSFEAINDYYEAFSLDENAVIGDSGVYTKIKESNQLKVRTYKSCSDCQVGFYSEYLISSPVVIHKDVAELYYNFLGEGFNDNISEVEIRINLPEKDTSDNFNYWMHVNLDGKIRYNRSNNSVIATLKRYRSNNSLAIRMTFDKDLILHKGSLTSTNRKALPSILKIEENRDGNDDMKNDYDEDSYYIEEDDVKDKDTEKKKKKSSSDDEESFIDVIKDYWYAIVIVVFIFLYIFVVLRKKGSVKE